MSKQCNKHIIQLATLLKNKEWTMVTAESCTAGGLAYIFSCLPTASPILEGGYIVYSEDAKKQLLGIKKADIKKYGAVSKQVAKKMAESALKNSKAQFSIAITGLAGPEGDGTGTPIGTIFFGLAAMKKKTKVYHEKLKGSRKTILKKTIDIAFKKSIDFLKK